MKKLEAGEHFAVALAEDGSVWAWGSNDGTFGNGSYYDSYYPTELRTLPEPISDIAAGPDFVLAVEEGGDALWVWGNNSSGQLGIGEPGGERPAPVRVDLASIGKAKQVEAGVYYSLMLTEEGEVYAWGANSSDELGTDLTGWSVPSPAPVLLSDSTPLSNVKDIEAGKDFFLALTNDGKVYAWGLNFHGQAGIGSSAEYYVTEPTELSSLNGATGVFANWEAYHAFATVGEAVYGWGNNVSSQLGFPENGDEVISPVWIPSLHSAKHISMGELHSLAVDDAGDVWGTGENNDGTLLTKPDLTAFEKLLSGEGAAHVSTTDEAVYVLREDGTVAVWGWNDVGQLGLGWVDSSDPIVEKHEMPSLTKRGHNVTYRFYTPEAADGERIALSCSFAQIVSETYGFLQGHPNADGSCTYYDLQQGPHELKGAYSWNADIVYDELPALEGNLPPKDVAVVPRWLPSELTFADTDYRPGYVEGYLYSDAETNEADIEPMYRLFFVDGTGARLSGEPILTTEHPDASLPSTKVPPGAAGLRYYVDDANTTTVESVPMQGWLPLLDAPWKRPIVRYEDENKADQIQGKVVIDETDGVSSVIRKYSIYYYENVGEGAERVDVATFEAGTGTKHAPLAEISANTLLRVEYQDDHGNTAYKEEVYAFDDISELPLPTEFLARPSVSFEFYDTDTDVGELGSSVYVSNPNWDSSFKGYRLYFLNAAGERLQGIAQMPSTNRYLNIYFNDDLAIPNGAVALGVFAYDSTGKEGQTANALAIWDHPVYVPENARYADDDPEPGAVLGKLRWSMPYGEYNIESYEIYAVTESYMEHKVATVAASSGSTAYEASIPQPGSPVMYYWLKIAKGAQTLSIASFDPYDSTKAAANLHPETDSSLAPPDANGSHIVRISENAFSGAVRWSQPSSGAKGYQLYFAEGDGDKLQSLAYVHKPLYKSSFEIYFVKESVPPGASQILIFTVGPDGRESADALSISLVGGSNPAAPAGIAFLDIDPEPGQLGGTVRWNAGADDSEVTEYRVYLMDAQGERLGEPIGIVPKTPNTSYRLDIPADRSAAPGAVVVLVVAMAGGEELAQAHLEFADAASLEEVLYRARAVVKPSGTVSIVDLLAYARRADRVNLAGDASFGKEDVVMLLQLLDPAAVQPPISQ